MNWEKQDDNVGGVPEGWRCVGWDYANGEIVLLVVRKQPLATLEETHFQVVQKHHPPKLVHVHAGSHHRVLHASITHCQAWLAFTSVTSADLYETCLVDLRRKRTYIVGTPTTHRQHLQFLPPSQDLAGPTRTARCRYVFQLDRDCVQVYAVEGNHDDDDQQPRKQRTLARKQVWSWWDQDAGRCAFYLVRPKQQQGARSSSGMGGGTGGGTGGGDLAIPVELYLSCTSFSDQAAGASSPSPASSRWVRAEPSLLSSQNVLDAPSASLVSPPIPTGEPPTPPSAPSAVLQNLSWFDTELLLPLAPQDVSSILSGHAEISIHCLRDHILLLVLRSWNAKEQQFRVVLCCFVYPRRHKDMAAAFAAANPPTAVRTFSLSIPAPRRENHPTWRARDLLVGVSGTLLFLLLPSVYLRLVDFGMDDGKEVITSVPLESGPLTSTPGLPSSPHLVPFPTISRDDDDPSSFPSAPSFFDHTSQCVYRARIPLANLAPDKLASKLQSWMSNTCFPHYNLFAYLLLRHGSLDPDSPGMHAILRKEPIFGFRSFFQEYLLSSIYTHLERLGTVEDSVLRLFPYTTLPALLDSNKNSSSSSSNSPRLQWNAFQTQLHSLEPPIVDIAATNAPWLSLLLTGQLHAETRTSIGKRLPPHKTTNNPRKRFDMFARLFSGGSSSEDPAISQEEFDPTLADKCLSDARDSVLRKQFQRAWVDVLVTQFRGQMGGGIAPFPTPSSSSFLARSFPRSGGTSSAKHPSSVDMEALRNKATAIVNEYMQAQQVQATALWNLLHDLHHFPKTFDFRNCRCRNCFPRRQQQEQEQQASSSSTRSKAPPQPPVTPTKGRRSFHGGRPTLPQPTITSLFAKIRDSPQRGQLMSRFEYLNNVMRAGMPTSGGAIHAPIPTDDSGSKSRGDAAPPSWTEVEGYWVDTRHISQFRLLQEFHLALEELGIPLPAGFHTKFILLGFHTLTRGYFYPLCHLPACLFSHLSREFLQFLDHGIFQITDSFIKHALDLLHSATQPEDLDFQFQLLTYLPHLNKFLRLVRPLPGQAPVFAEYQVAECLESAGLLRRRDVGGVLDAESMEKSLEALDPLRGKGGSSGGLRRSKSENMVDNVEEEEEEEEEADEEEEDEEEEPMGMFRKLSSRVAAMRSGSTTANTSLSSSKGSSPIAVPKQKQGTQHAPSQRRPMRVGSSQGTHPPFGGGMSIDSAVGTSARNVHGVPVSEDVSDPSDVEPTHSFSFANKRSSVLLQQSQSQPKQKVQPQQQQQQPTKLSLEPARRRTSARTEDQLQEWLEDLVVADPSAHQPSSSTTPPQPQPQPQPQPPPPPPPPPPQQQQQEWEESVSFLPAQVYLRYLQLQGVADVDVEQCKLAMAAAWW